jgi:hypothetical protein
MNVPKSRFHGYIPSRNIFAKEHIARYAFASKFCKGMRVLDVACARMKKLEITPGFETRNFAYLIIKFREWGINLSDIMFATPFDKIDFQMTPSRRRAKDVGASP